MSDYISRIRNFDDWKLDPGLFYVLDSAWGPHSVDCFAFEHSALISVRSPDIFLSIISFV